MSEDHQRFQTEPKAALSRLGYALIKAVLELGVAIILTVIISWTIEQAGAVGLIPQFIFSYSGTNATIQVVIFSIFILFGRCWSIPWEWIRAGEAN